MVVLKSERRSRDTTNVDAELRDDEDGREEEDGGAHAGRVVGLLHDLHELVRPPQETVLLIGVDAGCNARSDAASAQRMGVGQRVGEDSHLRRK